MTSPLTSRGAAPVFDRPQGDEVSCVQIQRLPPWEGQCAEAVFPPTPHPQN